MPSTGSRMPHECQSERADRKLGHQLGLYRTRVDAKTDEFLRMSRRRQLRSGAACAGLATAFTTVFVVVIILVYEYTLAGTSYAGPTIFARNTMERNKTEHADQPVADQLNRRRFAVDLESFSKMPLLINALQESSYLDQSVDQQASSNSGSQENQGRSFSSWTEVHRTSPRPFNFDLRTPSPSPFKKGILYSSRTWLDNYRSAQRLKNLEHVINYLQKTVHAKVADLVPSPSDRLVTFSGALMHPFLNEKHQPSNPGSPSLVASESKNVFLGQPFKSDILVKYKPNHPGEVNMLADEMFRFSPTSTIKLNEIGTNTAAPLFRPIKFPPRETCYGIKCPPHDFVIKQTNHSKLLDLMLGLFPSENKETEPFQQRRKIGNRQFTNPSFRPKLTSRYSPIYQKRNELHLFNNRPRPPYPIVMNRLFSPPRLHATVRNLKILGQESLQSNTGFETTTVTQTVYPTTNLFFETSSEESTPATTNAYRALTTLYTVTETPHSIDQSVNLKEAFLQLNNMLSRANNNEETSVLTVPPPQIVKFNPEDAKIVDPYHFYSQRRNDVGIDANASLTDKIQNIIVNDSTEKRSMVIMLQKNSVDSPSSTVLPSSTHVITTLLTPISAPTEPFITDVQATQNNGHYRSLSHNTRNDNDTLSTAENSEIITTSSLATTSETFRPSYVVINRKINKKSSDQQFGLRIQKDNR